MRIAHGNGLQWSRATASRRKIREILIVASSKALVPSSFFVTTSKAPVTTKAMWPPDLPDLKIAKMGLCRLCQKRTPQHMGKHARTAPEGKKVQTIKGGCFKCRPSPDEKCLLGQLILYFQFLDTKLRLGRSPGVWPWSKQGTSW